MKQSKALIAGVLAGIASPASIGISVDYPRLSGTDLSRLRGDASKVGRDFRVVLKKNNGESSKSAGSKAA